MDVLGGLRVALRSGSQVIIEHGLLMRAKDGVSRVFGVSSPGNVVPLASVTAAHTSHRIERTQHIRSIGFARSRGRCRFAVHPSRHRTGAGR
jgi:hypothetical protein